MPQDAIYLLFYNITKKYKNFQALLDIGRLWKIDNKSNTKDQVGPQGGIKLSLCFTTAKIAIKGRSRIFTVISKVVFQAEI